MRIVDDLKVRFINDGHMVIDLLVASQIVFLLIIEGHMVMVIIDEGHVVIVRIVKSHTVYSCSWKKPLEVVINPVV